MFLRGGHTELDSYIAPIATPEIYGILDPMDSNTIAATQAIPQFNGDTDELELQGMIPLSASVAPQPNHQTWEATQVGAGTITEANPGIDTPNPGPKSRSKTAIRQTRQTGRNRPVTCSTCNMTFDRTDVLHRHQREQHNTEERDRFLCPHDPCKKSKHGSGFKRQDQLNRHLLSCKILKRKAVMRSDIDQAGRAPLETLPETVAQHRDSPVLNQESEDGVKIDKPSTGVCDLVSELRKRRELEQAELDGLDQEREKRMQRIARIDQLINDLDQ